MATVLDNIPVDLLGILSNKYELHAILFNVSDTLNFHTKQFVNSLDYKNSSTIEEAAKIGNVLFFEYCIQRGFELNLKVFTNAAAFGHLELLKYLHTIERVNTYALCKEAAKSGNLELMKWLREQNCFWDYHTYLAAAKYGHLHIIEYALENGCLIDCPNNNCTWGITFHEQITNIAARKGYINILQYAVENKWGWDLYINTYAAEKGQIDALKWLHKNVQKCNHYTYVKAASAGKISILEWLEEEVMTYDRNNTLPLEEAASTGQLETVKWLHKRGFRLTELVFSSAGAGTIEVLEYLIDNNCPMDTYAYATAIMSNKLENIKWLHLHKCPYDNDSTLLAQNMNHPNPEIIKWLTITF